MNHEDQDENKIDGDLSKGDFPVLNYFFQHYPPASSFKTTTLTMTTAQVQEAIGDHSGMRFPIAGLYNWLIDRGYRQDTLGDGQFIWLFDYNL